MVHLNHLATPRTPARDARTMDATASSMVRASLAGVLGGDYSPFGHLLSRKLTSTLHETYTHMAPIFVIKG